MEMFRHDLEKLDSPKLEWESLKKDRVLLELAGQHLKNTIMVLLMFQLYRFSDNVLDKEFFKFRDMLCRAVSMLRKYRIEYFDEKALGQNVPKVTVEDYNPAVDLDILRDNIAHGDDQESLLEKYHLNFLERY